MQVSPFHASVLMHFQTRPEWPAAELAERMGVAPDALRRKIVFWINQGEELGTRAGHDAASAAGNGNSSHAARSPHLTLPHPTPPHPFPPHPPHSTPPGVLSESRVAGQQLVYRRNEQLQTGPAVAPEQEGMELEGGAADEHAVRLAWGGHVNKGRLVPKQFGFGCKPGSCA